MVIVILWWYKCFVLSNYGFYVEMSALNSLFMFISNFICVPMCDFSVCDIGMGFICNKVFNVPYIHVFYVCRAWWLAVINVTDHETYGRHLDLVFFFVIYIYIYIYFFDWAYRFWECPPLCARGLMYLDDEQLKAWVAVPAVSCIYKKYNLQQLQITK